jgi:hypothetical protein
MCGVCWEQFTCTCNHAGKAGVACQHIHAVVIHRSPIIQPSIEYAQLNITDEELPFQANVDEQQIDANDNGKSDEYRRMTLQNDVHVCLFLKIIYMVLLHNLSDMPI